MRSWLHKRVHVSWHIAGACAGILIGSALSALGLGLSVGYLLLALVLFGFVCLLRWRGLFLLACLAGCVIGLWRAGGERLALDAYRPYYKTNVTIRGVLHDDASYGQQGDQRIELQQIQISSGSKLHGVVWVSLAQKKDIKRGDTVTIYGKLGEGFGTVSASVYRGVVLRVQRPHPGDVARIFRDWFANGVRRAISEPESSLGIGYLTGQRSALPAELDSQLRVVGLTHAVVASGYNLTILVTFARSALANFSKYMATIAAGGMIVAFMLITGLSPSMSRAGLISGLGLLTWYYGRKIHPLVLLPFAAAVTVLIHPAYAWGDIGWSLSFAAFAGVIIVAPLARRYFWPKGHRLSAVTQITIDTVAAQLTTLPIILGIFGQYATYALPANLLVLPLVPVAMVLTFIAGLGGLLSPGNAHLMGLPAQWLLHYMTWIIAQIANIPGAQKEVHFGPGAVAASYVILSLLSIYLWRRTALDFRASEPSSLNPKK